MCGSGDVTEAEGTKRTWLGKDEGDIQGQEHAAVCHVLYS